MKAQNSHSNTVPAISSLDKLEEVVVKVIKQNWEIAEEKVIFYEEKRGWKAKKVEKCGYDILSVNGDQERHIEVKSKLGTQKKFSWTELTANETKHSRIDPNYFVYLVEGDSIEPDAPFIVIELDKAKLDSIVNEYTIVRFTKLGSLPRIQIQ
ncbi:MAG: DUF3883 domain-containing protein [Cytophagaceae bacterium]|nr:MAG: DUF3883 domain-containing protein [Cytophagaceae bacterium]